MDCVDYVYTTIHATHTRHTNLVLNQNENKLTTTLTKEKLVLISFSTCHNKKKETGRGPRKTAKQMCIHCEKLNVTSIFPSNMLFGTRGTYIQCYTQNTIV